MNEPFEMLRRLAWKKEVKSSSAYKVWVSKTSEGRVQAESTVALEGALAFNAAIWAGIQLWSSLLILLRHWEEIEVKGSQHLMLQKMISQDRGREG